MTVIRDEWAEVETVALDSYAIVPEDLTPLRSAMFRGSNLVMNGAAGQRPYAPVLDALDVTVVWKINGFRDPDGVAQSDFRAGLEENLELYRAAMIDGADALTGEKDWTLHIGASEVVAPVQVWDWSPVRTGAGTISVATRLVVADGSFAAPPP